MVPVVYLFIGFFFLPHHAACSILVPWSKTEPGPLAVKTWSPNHWTAREFPTCLFLLLLPLFLLSNPKTHQDWCQDAYYLCFFSRSFRVSGLRFKSLIHLEFIFVCFFYTWLSSFSNTICGRGCPFPVVYSCLYYFNWFWRVDTCLQMSGSSLECKLHKGMSLACSLFKL